jgi:hypothetical protein
MHVSKWIEEIDQKIADLTAARNLLIGASPKAAQPEKQHRQRKPFSEATRKKMSLRMKRQWRAVKRSGKSTLA